MVEARAGPRPITPLVEAPRVQRAHIEPNPKKSSWLPVGRLFGTLLAANGGMKSLASTAPRVKPCGARSSECPLPDIARAMLDSKWRPEPESNRRARICSPLRNHSAIGPRERSHAFPDCGRGVKSARPSLRQSLVHQRIAKASSRFDQWRLAAAATADMTCSLKPKCITGIQHS